MTYLAHQTQLAYLTGRSSTQARPPAVGEKFLPSGQVQPWAGNTFICHIPPGQGHGALVRAATALQDGPLAEAFSFLPPSSYHMTVFEGATHRDRTEDRWPRGLDPALPIDAVSAAFLPLVSALTLPAGHRIRPLGLFGGFSVKVTGADEAQTDSLWQVRAALRDATGLRRADFGDYRFHITLAYLLRWLSDDEAAAVLALSEQVGRDLCDAAPEMALAGVEFCRFDDMHAFPLIRRLS